jgi:hypothetical protein
VQRLGEGLDLPELSEQPKVELVITVPSKDQPSRNSPR